MSEQTVFVVTDSKQSCISASCLGLLVVAAATPFPLHFSEFRPCSQSSLPRCWQSAHLPNLDGIIEEPITLPTNVKLDKHKYLNLEQVSNILQYFLHTMSSSLPVFLLFPRPDIPEPWSHGRRSFPCAPAPPPIPWLILFLLDPTCWSGLGFFWCSADTKITPQCVIRMSLLYTTATIAYKCFGH